MFGVATLASWNVDGEWQTVFKPDNIWKFLFLFLKTNHRSFFRPFVWPGGFFCFWFCKLDATIYIPVFKLFMLFLFTLPFVIWTIVKNLVFVCFLYRLLVIRNIVFKTCVTFAMFLSFWNDRFLKMVIVVLSLYNYCYCLLVNVIFFTVLQFLQSYTSFLF